MPLRPLLLAMPLALSLPLAASAVTLQPVPWTSAGHGNPTSLAIPTFGSLDCVTGDTFQGCANSAGDEFVEDIPASEGPTLTLSTGTFDFSADIVSEVVGNNWTVGLTNISLVTPSASDPSNPVFFNLTLEALVFAVLDVPAASGDPTTELALSRTSTRLAPVFESDLLGAGSGLVYGGINTFVAGDRLTFVEALTFRIRGDTFAMPASRTDTACGTSDFLETSDCTVSMSVFQPMSVPEPRIGLLLGTAGALAGLLRQSGSAVRFG